MIHLCSSSIVAEILIGVCMESQVMEGIVGLNCGGYGDLFHLGCLWTLVLIGVGGGVVMYEGFICNLLVVCSNFDLRFGISIVVFL
jgi:hypothetical protein